MKLNERLEQVIARANLSMSQIARDIGVSSQAVQFWVSGRNEPKGQNLIRLCEYLGISREWLKDGIGEAPTVAGRQVVAIPDRPDIVPIPVCSLTFSAGPGCEPLADWQVEEQDSIYYPLSYFQTRGLDPKDCVFARVSGDSMSPTIEDDDLILVEKFNETRLGAVPINDGKIYVLSVDNDMRVKRIRKVKNGVEIVSDNPEWANESYTGDECALIRVYGRVIGSVRSY